MKKHRSIVAFLLIVALPYSAAAAIGDNFRCHQEGLGALAESGAMMHAGDGAMLHAHHASTPASDPHTCDCPVQCACAGGGGSALLMLNAAVVAPLDTACHVDSAYGGFFSDPQHVPLFRPPIAVLLSAA